MTSNRHTLSVVIITRNEGKKISKGLESVLAATQAVDSCEILLMDSASTDNTLEVAQQYPIRVMQLGEGCFLSPAAGRHVGFQNTDGEFVFFLDGDMTLEAEWFAQALPLLQNDPQLAGVAGRCEEIVFNPKTGEPIEHVDDRFEDDTAETHVTHLGGSALYRRSVLEEVGGFNPYLCNEEELELGLRIRAGGYELQRIDVPMSVHRTIYDSPENPSGLTWRQIRRDLRAGRYVALGQVLRQLQGNPLKSVYLRLYKKALLLTNVNVFSLIALLLTSVLVFAGVMADDLLPLRIALGWVAFWLSLFVLRMVAKRHFMDTCLFLADYMISSYGFVVGYLKGTPPVQQYLQDFQSRITKVK